MDRRLTAVALLLLALPLFADDARTQRLETLARVWAAAKYTHPAFLMRAVDWDGALVRAIPAVRAAATPGELAAAIDAMLKELGDPVTRVVTPRATTVRDVQLIRQEGDVLVIDAGPYIDAKGGIALWTREDDIAAALAKAKGVKVDLTIANGAAEMPELIEILAAMPWSSEPVPVPGVWTTLYSGYPPQQGGMSGDYHSALMLVPSKPLPAAKSAPARITLVTDGVTPLPAFAVALARAGKATIESPSPVSDAASTIRVQLGDGAFAQIRKGSYAAEGGGQAPSPVPLVEARYPEMTAPDLPYRLLAAFRIWSVIDDFYPYKGLIGDWDAVLREYIPRFEDAEGEDAYAAAVLEMIAHVDDGHTGASGHPGAARLFGAAFVPLRVERVENAFVVTEKYDPAAPGSIGDVVVSVDGEPLDARVQRLWKYVTASTRTARTNRVAAVALRGPAKSVAQLGLRGADGTTHVLAVPRMQTLAPRPPAAAPYRLLDGNIGYVDLRLLETTQVYAMFDALMKTKAIVFDMRGYPNGTAWPIAARINTRHALYGASFRRAQLGGAATAEETPSRGYYFDQTLPKTTKPLYTGKVVVLIDNRAISQAEHTCLFFEQAAGATFAGSPTAGANGDVTNFPLPGGFTVRFSGHDVRHADGRQLQRVGIQPDIRVEPTIAGLRAGKDEVLERAIAYVNGKQ
jgi:C-terminal processing protease CtpA/Prc